MAGNYFSASQVQIFHHLQPNGHDGRFYFALYNLAALRDEWTYIEPYDTRCKDTPTTWEFRLTLRRDPNSGMVSGNAVLERTDYIEKSVVGYFVLTFRHYPYYNDYVPRDVHRAVPPGDKKSAVIISIVPLEYRHLLHKEIVVDLQLSVRKCHDRKSYGSSGAEGGYWPPGAEGGYWPPGAEGGYWPPGAEGGYSPRGAEGGHDSPRSRGHDSSGYKRGRGSPGTGAVRRNLFSKL